MKRQVVYIEAGAILSDRPSGIGHLTLHTLRGLLALEEFTRTYEIRLIVPAAKAYLLDQWNLEGARVVRLPLLSRIWNVWPRIPFAPPIDLFLGKGVYVFSNYKKWPLLFSESITYIHDISYELFPQFAEPRNLAMLQGNVPKWIKESTIVVTDSESSRKEIIDFYKVDPKKIVSVYCGVDGNFTRRPKREVEDVKQKYGIDKNYFLFLSNLEPRKNIVRLLKAFQGLPESFKERYALVLVGGMSWQNEEILAEIKKAKVAGWAIVKPDAYVPDEDIPALLSGAEALVHPALHEGFGIPVLEAMATGTPVIAADIPVLREVAGDAALYVNVESSKDITSKIEDIVTDAKLRKKLVSLGKKRATGFTWSAAAAKLATIIKEIKV